MQIKGLDGIVILVKDLKKATALYSKLLGYGPLTSGPFKNELTIDKPGHRSKLRMLGMPGNWYIELQEPQEGPKEKFLQEKGEGSVYALSFLVEDIERAYDELKKEGITPVVTPPWLSEQPPSEDKKYFPGLAGEKIFFLPFDKTGGIYIELVERHFNIEPCSE
ncbi:VOC family protein [[Eubacterium] cellulosolvens]